MRADAFHRTPETPLSIKNINRSEMMRMPGAVLDLSKVVQNFPGVLPKPSFWLCYRHARWSAERE